MKIAAVVVTYNRLQLLIELIQQLKNQTRKLDEIIVINNSSTDGTLEWLETQNDLTIINQDNSGGAGGFYTGIKYAYEKGHEWIMGMDDDIAIVHNAVDCFLRYTNIAKYIIGGKKYDDGIRFNLNIWFNNKKGKIEQIKNYNWSMNDFIKINVGCFEGFFIHRDIISKIGLPDKRFFIVHDDTIYGYLASKYTDIIYLKEILFTKKVSVTKKIYGRTKKRISNLYYYYSFRNQFIINAYLKDLNEFNRISYIYYFIHIVKTICGIIIYDHEITKIKLIIEGIVDGIKKKYGKRIIL